MQKDEPLVKSDKSKGPAIEAEKLYRATRLLDLEDKKKLGMLIPAVVYVQDPLVAANDSRLGLKPLFLEWDPSLSDGPTNSRIAIVDYDADHNILTPPVKWNEEEWQFTDPDDQPIHPLNQENPYFRQINVWAIIQYILTFYQAPQMLGRAIPWAFEGNRLIVVPNAGYAQNAFYDRYSKSLQFYYCGKPDELVYTCLSHDIIAHETGHAILDGIRPLFNEVSSIQSAAFHEFIADLTAILSALRNNDVRGVVAEVTDGDLTQEEVIGDLAEMFGETISKKVHGPAARPYLRTAHNRKTLQSVEGSWDIYDSSLVLTGGMFEVLSKMVLKHRNPKNPEKGKSPKEALWDATRHFTRIAIRALDYCPPMDIQFIDYIRAVLHADEIAYPHDGLGYRELIREVFHERGFCDCKVAGDSDCKLNPPIPPYSIEFHRYDIERLSRSRTAAYHFLNNNRELLCIPKNQDLSIVDLYDTNKVAEAERRLPREIVLEYMWREDIPLEGHRFGFMEGKIAQLLCGGTIVFDGRGNILYVVKKPGLQYDKDTEEGMQRRDNLLSYVEHLVGRNRIGLLDESLRWGLDTRRPAVEARNQTGGIRLEITPHLRNHGEDVRAIG